MGENCPIGEIQESDPRTKEQICRKCKTSLDDLKLQTPVTFEKLKDIVCGRYYFMEGPNRISSSRKTWVVSYGENYEINPEDTQEIQRILEHLQRSGKDIAKYSIVKDFIIRLAENVQIGRVPTIVSTIPEHNGYERYTIADALIQESKHKNYPENLDKERILEEIQATTKEVVKDKKTDEEKISAIYQRIIDHIIYVEEVDHNNFEQSSGLMAYQNGEAICSGFSRLFIYMLIFAGISNVTYEIGDVIDANTDYDGDNEINPGHAWVRIGGDTLYDPTWDAENYRNRDALHTPGSKRKEVTYYGLPEDIFFATRYKDGETPVGEFDDKSPEGEENRKLKVLRRLYDVYGSYERKGNTSILQLPIFKEVRILRWLNIEPGQRITLDVIRKKLPLYEFDEDGVSKDKKFIYRGPKGGYLITNDSNDNLSSLRELRKNEDKDIVIVGNYANGRYVYTLTATPNIEPVITMKDLQKRVKTYQVDGGDKRVTGRDNLVLIGYKSSYTIDPNAKPGEIGSINSILGTIKSTGDQLSAYSLLHIDGEIKLAKDVVIQPGETVSSLADTIKIFVIDNDGRITGTHQYIANSGTGWDFKGEHTILNHYLKQIENGGESLNHYVVIKKGMVYRLAKNVTIEDIITIDELTTLLNGRSYTVMNWEIQGLENVRLRKYGESYTIDPKAKPGEIGSINSILRTIKSTGDQLSAYSLLHIDGEIKLAKDVVIK